MDSTRVFRVFRRIVPRLPDWRRAVVTVALIGTMLLSALAALGMQDAWIEHRTSMMESMEEYAGYAARAFGDQLIHEGGQFRLRLAAPVLGTVASDTGKPMTLAEYESRVRDMVDESIFSDESLLGFFRLDMVSGDFQGTDAAAEPRLGQIVRDSVLLRLPQVNADREPALVQLVIDGEPVNIAFARQRVASGVPTVAFGVVMSRREWMRKFGDDIMTRLPLVPPSLISPEFRFDRDMARSDTVVSVRVISQSGLELYRSPGYFESHVSRTVPFNTRPGGYVVQASLHPAFVSRVTELHRHANRRRALVVLPVLSILLAFAAMVHLMRERELVRSRRDFVASVSHELRTPLAQIRMYSETLLLRRERTEDERMKWLGVISREARRLADLVESILLFSHIEAARARIEPERTDLGDLVEDIVEAYLPMASARRMRIVADAPLRIYADVDPRAMRQVVVNLLDNALKYGPEGQTIRVDLERKGGGARLCVTDEGPGIAPRDRQRLWRPFVRLAANGATVGGSGIGLSVVRSIVEYHGGTVRVENAEAGGARFIIDLPLSDDESGVPLALTTTAEIRAREAYAMLISGEVPRAVRPTDPASNASS